MNLVKYWFFFGRYSIHKKDIINIVKCSLKWTRARLVAINDEMELLFVTGKIADNVSRAARRERSNVKARQGNGGDGIGTWDYFGLSVNVRLWNKAHTAVSLLPTNFNLTRIRQTYYNPYPALSRGLIISRCFLRAASPCLIRRVSELEYLIWLI